MEFPSNARWSAAFSIIMMLNICAVGIILSGPFSASIKGDNSVIESLMWLTWIGVAVYLLSTISLLIIYRLGPENMAFDFSGYYTDIWTHVSLAAMSIPAYLIIFVLQKIKMSSRHNT